MPKKMKGLIFFLVTFLAGCATVKIAPEREDAKAKLFTPSNDKARVYIFRKSVLYLGRRIGIRIDDSNTYELTTTLTYLVYDLTPGKHKISSISIYSYDLEADFEAGKIYFVELDPQIGFPGPNARLYFVSDEEGRGGVNQCELIDKSFRKRENSP